MYGHSVGLGSRNRVRKKSPLFCWSRGKIEPAELSRWHLFLVHCCPGHKSTSKTVPGIFSRTLHHHMGPKGLRSGFQRMFFTSLLKRLRHHLPPIWILWILKFVHTLRARSRPFSLEPLKIKLQKEWTKIPQKEFRDSCKAFSKRLQLVIDTDGGHIEWFGSCLSKPYSTQIHLLPKNTSFFISWS